MRFFFLLLAAGAAYFVATHTEFHFYTSSSQQPLGVLDGASSPDIADVRALVDASASSKADETAVRVNVLLRRAAEIGPARGAALLRRRLPALVAEIDGAIPVLHRRIAAVPVRTGTGTSCRPVLQNLVAHQGYNFRMLGSEVTGRTWRAVDRFAGRANRINRWYAAQIAQCTKAVAPEDRTALVHAMAGT